MFDGIDTIAICVKVTKDQCNRLKSDRGGKRRILTCRVIREQSKLHLSASLPRILRADNRKPVIHSELSEAIAGLLRLAKEELGIDIDPHTARVTRIDSAFDTYGLGELASLMVGMSLDGRRSVGFKYGVINPSSYSNDFRRRPDGTTRRQPRVSSIAYEKSGVLRLELRLRGEGITRCVGHSLYLHELPKHMRWLQAWSWHQIAARFDGVGPMQPLHRENIIRKAARAGQDDVVAVAKLLEKYTPTQAACFLRSRGISARGVRQIMAKWRIRYGSPSNRPLVEFRRVVEYRKSKYPLLKPLPDYLEDIFSWL